MKLDGYRVLVVGVARKLARALEAAGNIVHATGQNSRVQAGLTSGTWDAVLLDAEQLKREGYDLVRHAREAQPNLAVLIVGDDGAETAHLAVLAGADEFLSSSGSDRMLARRVGLAISFRRVKARSHLIAPLCHVLMVDWDQVEAPAVRATLAKANLEVTQASSPWAALKRLRSAHANVLLTSPSAEVDGSSIVEAALRYDPRLRIIVTSEAPNLSDVAAVVALGACDYLLRPVGPEQALGAVNRAWAEYKRTTPTGCQERSLVRVLIVEPRDFYAKLLEQMLGLDRRLSCMVVGDVELACARLAERDFDAIVYSPDPDRSDAQLIMRQLRGKDPRPAIVVLQDGPDHGFFAERALRLGAQDVVAKRTLGREALGPRVRNAVMRNRHQLQHERFVRDLQTREASQQEVVRRSVDGLVIVDSRGFVVFANPAAEKLFDVAASELLGTRFPFEVSIESPSVTPLRDGATPCVAEMSAVHIDWNGAPATLVALRDVTERHQAQTFKDQMAHTERLAAIGQLAAGVTHEINNPAAYVMANLEAMQEVLLRVDDGRLNDEQRQAALDEVRQMVAENIGGMERIRAITQDLRTFARIDSAELTPVCLNDCVEVACRIAINEIRHRAHLVVQVEELPTVTGSHGKLAQVVTNLLVNAAHALPEGDVDAHRITVRTGSTEDSVWLRVEDTGVGIPEKVLGQMFDPFFTTKKRAQGTGLGLALCADIVRQHNGKIHASNRPEGGASLELTLPRDTQLSARPPSNPTARVSGFHRPRRSSKVLLIDDEPLVLRSLRRLLSNHHQVITAPSGREGLAILERDRHFDAIFCDLMMPEMDGAAVFREIESKYPLLVEKVVFCSGGAFTERTKALLERACRPLVPKPLTREVFESALAEIAAQPLALSSSVALSSALAERAG